MIDNLKVVTLATDITAGQPVTFRVVYNYFSTSATSGSIKLVVVKTGTSETWVSQTKTVSIPAGSGTAHVDFPTTAPTIETWYNATVDAMAYAYDASGTMVDAYIESQIARIVPPPSPVTITNLTCSRYYPPGVGFNEDIHAWISFNYSCTQAAYVTIRTHLKKGAQDVYRDEVISLSGSGTWNGRVSVAHTWGCDVFDATLSVEILWSGQQLANLIIATNIYLAPLGVIDVNDVAGLPYYPPGSTLTIRARIKNYCTLQYNASIGFIIYFVSDNTIYQTITTEFLMTSFQPGEEKTIDRQITVPNISDSCNIDVEVKGIIGGGIFYSYWSEVADYQPKLLDITDIEVIT